MSTTSKIEDLIATRYDSYNNFVWEELKELHEAMRIVFSDEEFLSFLEEQEIETRKPAFILANEIKITLRSRINNQ